MSALLAAQVAELDRRLARMDVLISMLEADLDRTDLSLAAMADQRRRISPPAPAAGRHGGGAASRGPR